MAFHLQKTFSKFNNLKMTYLNSLKGSNPIWDYTEYFIWKRAFFSSQKVGVWMKTEHKISKSFHFNYIDMRMAP